MRETELERAEVQRISALNGGCLGSTANVPVNKAS